MKKVISTLLFVLVIAALLWIILPKGEGSAEFGIYKPDVQLQQAEPLITGLPTMAYIDSVINSDYNGEKIISLYIENSNGRPALFVNKSKSSEASPIKLSDFLLPYTQVLDVVVMAKRVEWKSFAGIPYYRIDNGYEAESVNASTVKGEPFLLTNELLKLYIEQIYGVDAQYSTERDGAVVIVKGSNNEGKFDFMINTLTFEIKEL